LGGEGKSAFFLIVETDPPSNYAGINGSYFVPKSTEWPVLHVRIGQNVSIHVINCASSEPHGFQVQYYDERQNISIQPGQSYDVTFLATKAGTFRIYCNIPCAIHALMQNGALIIS
jgi:heme/copper-type cytochrome/quinol oxidase subunit 2